MPAERERLGDRLASLEWCERRFAEIAARYEQLEHALGARWRGPPPARLEADAARG